jgi:site-specific recombinase XerD
MKGARPLTPEEIQAVSQSFSGNYAVRDKCLFLLGVNIGARVSELTALKVGDVWQHSRPVDILTLRKGTVKGKKESHCIPLNATAKAVIFELMEWKEMQGEDTSPQAYLFASRKGSGRLSRVQAHRILKKAYEKAVLTGKVTTHSMRKTVANAVYSATSDLFVVKEILGHKNLSTTQQYLGVGFSKLQEAMDTLDECNFRYNTLHSKEKLKKGQVQKSFRRRKSAKKFLSMQKGKVVSFEKRS